MTEVLVRRAVPADLGGIATLLEEADELHRQAVPWLFRRVDGPEQAAFREAYLSKPDHVAFLAVTEEDAPVGVICVLLRPQSPAPIIQPAVVAEIDVLAVTARFRRRGIGKRLVEAALDWAKLAGASRTLLGVHEFNQSARAFWASLGFEILTYRMVRHMEPDA